MIYCKSDREINLMRKAGKVLNEALQLASEIAMAGVTTNYINDKLEEFLIKNNCRPIFKGYRGFPKSICASVNNEVVHGIPNDYILKDGDILSIDIGAEYKKYMADMAKTFPIGEISTIATKLIDVCKESLELGIKVIKSDIKLETVSETIQNYVESKGFSIVRDYTGHGIGRKMHEDPQVPNFVSTNLKNNSILLTKGMTIAIEPMICEGLPDTSVLDNNWTVITQDKLLSAHFEHTIAITDDGPDVLTI